jgi:ubiquinone/menaquinone biosynthesis C-methylase UbiE
MTSNVESSYARRAAEYTEHLGSMEAVHLSDVHLVTTWAEQIDGPLLDAGCGPGHWTGHLRKHGIDAHGVDLVDSFIAHARTTYPDVGFEVGNVDALPHPTASLGGVLAWYSLIHHTPGTIGHALTEFARVVRPGGGLLVGFFVGATIEPFDHAVVTAYRWSPEALGAELAAAGFDIVESHTRTAPAPGPRPHGAIIARRRSEG